MLGSPVGRGTRVSHALGVKHRHLAHAGSPESLKTRVEELHRQLAGGVEGLQSADRWRQMLEFASRRFTSRWYA